jgi:DNA-binding transcriptional LysR family regulator
MGTGRLLRVGLGSSVSVVVKMGVAGAIQQAGSTELGRLLGERSVDVIFRAVADESPGFVSIPLARSALAVVCNADHALAGHAAVDFRALSGSALVGYPLGWEARTLSDRVLRSRGVEPRYAFEVNDTWMLLDLVEIGLGVAVFPEAIAAPRGARLREVAISGRRWDWTVRAEALAPGPSNPAAHALWTMLPDQDPALTGA